MFRILSISLLGLFLWACSSNGANRSDTGQDSTPADAGGMDVTPPSNGTPFVTSEPTYTVLEDLDITYAEGLAHDETSTTSFSIPLLLDVYYPDNDSSNRPVLVFIHGGGFTGGTKTKPEIVDMARYYASRGWVFVSIDYRTTEELCDSEKMPLCKDRLKEMGEKGPEGIVAFYKGIAPTEWVTYIVEAAPASIKSVQQGIAQYAAQRDAKSALRWVVANASSYGINTNHIAVGGASAGAITTIALGISNPEDFRDEITVTDDPTLATANLEADYEIQQMIYFWGSNAKLDLHEAVYQLEPYDRYDSDDPELFMGHGTATDLVTPYEGALELQDVYDSLGIHNELATLFLPNGEPAGHGAWDGQVDGKGLSELTFEFLVERQELTLQ